MTNEEIEKRFKFDLEIGTFLDGESDDYICTTRLKRTIKLVALLHKFGFTEEYNFINSLSPFKEQIERIKSFNDTHIGGIAAVYVDLDDMSYEFIEKYDSQFIDYIRSGKKPVKYPDYINNYRI